MNSFRFFRRRLSVLGSPLERADRRYKPLSRTSDLLSLRLFFLLHVHLTLLTSIYVFFFQYQIYQEFPIALSVVSLSNPPVLILFSVVFKDSKIWSFLGLQGLPDFSRLFGIVGSVSFFFLSCFCSIVWFTYYLLWVCGCVGIALLDVLTCGFIATTTFVPSQQGVLPFSVEAHYFRLFPLSSHSFCQLFCSV